MLALFNSKIEVNIIHLTFAKELGFFIKLINVRVQKIDSIILDIYRMIVAVFLVTNKANQIRFFNETFLVANVSLEVVFEIFFFTLSGTNIDFLD